MRGESRTAGNLHAAGKNRHTSGGKVRSASGGKEKKSRGKKKSLMQTTNEYRNKGERSRSEGGSVRAKRDWDAHQVAKVPQHRSHKKRRLNRMMRCGRHRLGAVGS